MIAPRDPQATAQRTAGGKGGAEDRIEAMRPACLGEAMREAMG